MSSANLAVTPVAEDVTIGVHDVVTHYGTREVLHKINLDIRRGETMVILGGSGSGKSTLIRHIVGLERVTSGSIHVLGQNVVGLSERAFSKIRKKVGMSFQGSALFNSLTIAENVALPLREHTELEDSTIRI